jgi:hypothetical protein
MTMATHVRFRTKVVLAIHRRVTGSTNVVSPRGRRAGPLR